MDARRARQLIDGICAELDELAAQLGRSARPLGVGALLALSAVAGCAKDAYGMPPRDMREFGTRGDAYGVPRDTRPQARELGSVRDAYGVPAKEARPSDGLPPVGDAYGVPADLANKTH